MRNCSATRFSAVSRVRWAHNMSKKSLYPFGQITMTTLKIRSPWRWAQTRLAHTLALGGIVVAASACGGLTDSQPTPNRYGSVSIRANATSATTARANATAIFFDAFTAAVPNSALNRNDRCEYSVIDTTTVITRGNKRAGNEVTMAIGASNISMAYDAGLFRYANAFGTPFSYASGDNAQVSIPGEGELYPSANISVPLAEPLLPGPVVVPTGVESMTISWNASADTTSAVILSLRYANPSTSSFANEQIYCALKDDGSHQLSSTSLAAFLASPANKRSLVLTRWRTRESLVDSRTLLHIASSIDTTITFQP